MYSCIYLISFFILIFFLVLLFCSFFFFFFFMLIMSLHYFFFFFSSRRRHTRCLSDWSSDVCSSDLRRSRAGPTRRRGRAAGCGSHGAPDRSECGPRPRRRSRTTPRSAPPSRRPAARSEERRVGKECRSRRRTNT